MEGSIISTTQWTRRVATAFIILLTASSIAPGVVVAISALPAPASTIPSYAHQLALLQNPIMDPGFELGASTPFWTGGTVVNGALELATADTATQSIVGVGNDLVGGVSPFVGASALAFRAHGNGSVHLTFLDQNTGATFLALSAPFRDANGVVRFDIPQTEELAQSSPFSLSITADSPLTVDDVVLQGVAYGTPRANLDLGHPLPGDADGALATLESTAAGAGAHIALRDLVATTRYAHDGYSLLVLPLDFTPAGGVGKIVAAPDTIGAMATSPGTWRFAVFLVEHAPSGAHLLSAKSMSDARLVLSNGTALDAAGEDAAVRQLVTASQTAYASLLPFADLSATGVVFKTQTVSLSQLSLIAIWNAPQNDGGLYAATDARGFFHPAKLALAGSPVADALDAVNGPVSAFAVGAIPCVGQNDITFRLANADCDSSSNVDEVRCSLLTPDGTLRPFKPDPTDAKTTCDDQDGDGLVAASDPDPYAPGQLDVSVTREDGAAWWSGSREIAYALHNTYNDNNRETPLQIHMTAVFQTANDQDLDGLKLDCTGSDIITSDEDATGVCDIDTSLLTDAASYRVKLVAEIEQDGASPYRVGADLGRAVGVDNTPPSGTAAVPNASPSNGWFTTPIDITFQTRADLSGIARVLCSADGAPEATCTHAPFSSAGSHTLSYRAVDNAGNAETTQATTFRLDLHDPTVACAATTPPTGAAGWHLAPFDVDCAGAGDAPTTVTATAAGHAVTLPYAIIAAGVTRIVGSAVDEAGRHAADASFDAQLDLAAPVSTIHLSPAPVSASLFGSAVTASFTATDDASGADHLLVSLDGAAPSALALADTISIATDGDHHLCYQAIDAAGRAEDERCSALTIDTSAPNAGKIVQGVPGERGWFLGSADVTIDTSSVNDLASVTYAIDGAAQRPYTGAVHVATAGNHTFVAKVTDTAGHVQTLSFRVPVDISAPTLSITAPAVDGSNGWYVTPIAVSFAASDDASTGTVSCRVDGGAFAPCTQVSLSGGVHVVEAYAQDEAGQRTSITASTFKLSLAPPTLTCAFSRPYDGDAWFRSSVDVVCSATAGTPGFTLAASTNGGSFASVPSTFTVSATGINNVLVHAIDDAGLVSADIARAVKIDRTAPLTRLSLEGTSYATNAFHSSVTVSLQCDDADGLSGCAGTQESIDGAAFAPYAQRAVSTDGTHTVRYYSTDLAGNAGPVESATFTIDQTSPHTLAQVSGTLGTNGWYRSDLSVALSASDDATSVQSLYVSLDDAAFSAYSGPISISGEGYHNLSYYAVDAAGNREAANRLPLKIDTTAPTAVLAFDGTHGLAGWYLSAVQGSVAASDATSGVVDLEFTVGGSGFQRSTGAPFTVSTQGLTAVSAYAVDAAGNVGPTTTVQVKIDSIKPVTTATPTGTAAANGWYSSAVQVALSASDAGSGVTGTQYALDGGAFQAYSAPFTVSGDLAHVVQYRSTDVAGNVGTTSTLDVKIDHVAPSPTGLQTSGTQGLGGWYTTIPHLTFRANDDTSGIDVQRISLDGGVTTTSYHSAEVGLDAPGQGTFHVQFQATDLAGLSETQQLATIRVDSLAPTTTASAAGTLGANGWYTSAPTVTLVATDPAPGSGVALVEYRIDGGAWQPYAAPFAVATDGTHAIEHRATDAAGNLGAIATLTVKVDRVAPATTRAITGPIVDGSEYYQGTTHVVLTALDATSGVDAIHFTTDGATWATSPSPADVAVSALGTTTVTYYAVDAAGNAEPSASVDVKIDDIKPTTTLHLTGTLGLGGYYTTPVGVSFTVDDGPSGHTTLDHLGSAADSTYAAAFQIATEGTNTLSYHSVSGAGLVETERARTILVDTSDPFTTANLSGTLGSNGFYTTPVTVTLTGIDNVSGPAGTFYALDGATFRPYTAPFTVSALNATTVTFHSVDVAGRVESDRVVSFSIDTVTPTTTPSVSGTLGANGWYVHPATVSLSVQHGPSGATTTYTIDGGAPQTYTAPFTISTDATHTISFASASGAGLVETAQPIVVKVDQVAPVTSSTLTGTLTPSGFYNTTVLLTLDAADATSQVAHTYYRVNGGSWTEYVTPVTIDGAGDITVDRASIDNAGNNETFRTDAFKIDRAAPVTTAALVGLVGTNGWYRSAVDVYLNATAGPSGVSATQADLAGGSAFADVTSPLTVSAEGAHTLAYRSVSGAQVAESAKSVSFKLDTVAPATTLDATGSQGANGYFTSAARVTLSAVDATSHVNYTEYSVDSSAWTRYTGPFNVNGPSGVVHVAFRSVDLAGNPEADQHATLLFDLDDITTFITPTGTLGLNGWYVSPVAINLTANAGPSGVRSIEQNVDSAGFAAYAGNFSVTGEGAHTVTARATNGAGTVQPTPASFALKIDTVAPVTTAHLSATDGANGWKVSAVTITLNATDEQSGVARSESSLDGGAFLPTTGTIVVSAPGPHTVAYRSVDAAGLVEVAHVIAFKIDAAKPVTTRIVNGTLGLAGWYVSPVSVDLAATAGPSNVSATSYTLDGATSAYTGRITISDDLAHALSYHSTSGAGVDEDEASVSIPIDTTPPTADSHLTGTLVSGWYTTPVTLTLTADDITSGVQRIEYRVNGGAWSTYSDTPLVFAAQGTTNVDFRAFDVAGNVNAIQPLSFQIDTVGPTLAVAKSGTAGDEGWYTSAVDVTLTPTDPTPGSGGAYVQSSAPGANDFSNASATFTLSSDGTFASDHRAVDAVGNAGPTVPVTVKIDRVVPTTRVSGLDATPGLSGWVRSSAIVTLANTSGPSGPAITRVSLDGAVASAYAGPVTVTGDGLHIFTYATRSVAGLTEAGQTLPVRIDTVAPETSLQLAGTSGAASWFTSSHVTATLVPTDAMSGVAGCSYTLDGAPGSGTTIDITGEGAHALTYACEDVAGNVEPTHATQVKIDTRAPSIAGDLAGTIGNGNVYVSDVTLHLRATDPTPGSDVAQVLYALDGGAETSIAGATADPVLTAQGFHNVTFRALDAAGLTSASTTLAFRIDSLAPVTDVTLVGTHGEDNWFTTAVSAYLNSTDGPTGTGVVSTSYSLDGSAFFPCGCPVAVSSDAVHTLTARAVDVAGNVELRDVSVKIDSVPPTTSANVSGTQGQAGWLASAATVSLTASDALSGVRSIEARVDGGAFAPYTGAITLATEGVHAVEYRATDVAGNLETLRSVVVKIDIGDPTVAASFSGTLGAGGVYISPVTLTASGADATSGLSALRYSLDGGVTYLAYSSSVTISAEGTTHVCVSATDVAGHTSAASCSVVRIDTQAPVTTLTVSATAGNAGWFLSAPTVTLSATDPSPGSGVASSALGVDAPATPYDGARTVAGEGSHALSYASTDVAGNHEPARAATLRVDTVAPFTSASQSDVAGASGWHTTSPVRVTLAASDATSGVDHLVCALDGATLASCAQVSVSAEGPHDLSFYAVDVAGKTEPQRTVAVDIDTLPPTTTATITGNLGQNGWYLGAVTIALAGNDATSGLAGTQFSLDAGAWTSYQTALTVATEGAHVISFRSVDEAGNAEATKTLAFSLDTQAPTVTAQASGTPGNAGWAKSPVTVTLTASDTQSGVREVRYRLGAGSEALYSGPVTVNAEGTTSFTYRALDNAGRSSANETISIKIDSRAPSTTNATSCASAGLNGYCAGAVSVTLAATDPSPGSGGALVSYSLDDAPGQSYAGALNVATDGDHKIVYSATDVAGNAESTKLLRFSIDATAPRANVTLVPSANGFSNGYYTKPVTVRLSADDAVAAGQSGLASFDCKLDGAAFAACPASLVVSANGAHTYAARATDRAGNSVTSTASFSIESATGSSLTLTVSPYATTVTTSTPDVSAVFGPVLSGWNASTAFLRIDGAAGPRCATSGTSSLTISCKPVTYKEAFAEAVTHTVEACVSSNAGVVYCASSILSAKGSAAWTFNVHTTDWDQDHYANNLETQSRSLPYDPYSVPYDPAGWGLRQSPNDPTSPTIANDNVSFAALESFVHLHFASYRYADDPTAFAPSRTGDLGAIDKIQVMEPETAAQVPPRGGNVEAASIVLNDSTTTLVVSGASVLTVPARAVVSYDPGAPAGIVSLHVRSATQTLADLRLNAATQTFQLVLYGTDGAPILTLPEADTDHDGVPNDVESLFGSNASDPASTPVPASDASDGYAVILQPLTATDPASDPPASLPQPAIIFSDLADRPAFHVLVHVDDLNDGGRSASLAGKRFDFAVIRADRAAQALATIDKPDRDLRPLFNTSELAPSAHDVQAAAEWSTTCVIGATCANVRLAAPGDDSEILVAIPDALVGLGPYVLWAHVDMPHRAGVDSASGYYNAFRSQTHDAPIPGKPQVTTEETTDDAPTPVIFVTFPHGNATGANADADGYSTLAELGLDRTDLTSKGSDPFDGASTPSSDDDQDGCKNRDEQIPSWVLATPGGCSAGLPGVA